MIMSARKFSVGLVGLALVFALAGVSHGEWLCIEKDWDDYGHVQNTADGICASSATINSFVYLQNTYQDIYDDQKLVKDYDGNGVVDNDDWETARDLLAYGWTNDQGVARDGIYGGTGGGTDQRWWEAKMHWLDDFAPGTTVVSGQVGENDPTGWYRGSALEHAYTTWDFLWTELGKCEDVELGFWGLNWDSQAGRYDFRWAHAVTLWGLCFDDDGDGDWEDGETRKVRLLDNNTPDKDDIFLELKYGTMTDEYDTYTGLYFENYAGVDRGFLALAFSESPVPEPSVLVGLLSMAVMGLVIYRRRRNRAA